LGVNDPPKDEQTGGPTGVTLSELLDRSGLLTILGVVGIEWTEDIVKSTQKYTTHSLQSLWIALSDAKKIIDEDLHASQLAPVGMGESWVDVGRLGHSCGQVVARW
jgi:hypothetical protein